MTPSELKYQIEQSGSNPYFFTRKTMQFFGDTMKNYGVCSCEIEEDGINVPSWELYRKRPVKHGLQSSAYFRKDNFARIYKRE